MKKRSWILRNLLAIAALSLGANDLAGQSVVIRFATASYTVKESTALTKIIVTRQGMSAETLTVDFATMDAGGGNATAGVDYYPTNGTLTFGPGVTSQFFYLGVINDTEHELNETVLLQLSNPSVENALGQASTSVTITDNDPCVYVLTPSSRTHGAEGGVASFQVDAAGGCSWIAEKTADWIGIIAGIGSGPGEVTYGYDALPEGVTSRSTTIQVGGKAFTITQTRPPPPVVTFRTPAEGSRQTNATITVTGRATSLIGVTNVEAQVENTNGTSAFAPAEGTAEWSAQISGLVPGTNTIRVRAMDSAGHTGENLRRVVYVPVSPLTITKEGQGTVTPYASGQLLEVGKSYSLLAKPASGHFFNGWSGGVESTENPVTFTMSDGLAVQANFVPSPFTNLAGVYAGLLTEDPTLRHASSGSISLKLGPLGTFSAKLVLGGKRVSFSGRFGLDGLATNQIAGTEETVRIVLGLDLAGAGEQLSGTATGGSWSSSILAYRDVFDAAHPAPQTGRYTLILPGHPENAAAEPGGDGFATIVIGTDGTAKLSGTLGDGTKLSVKAPLSGAGGLAVYLSLSGGRGSLLGWLVFADNPGSDVAGTLSWFGPPRTGLRYPAGFATQTDATGSIYHAPSGGETRVLSLTEGSVSFTAGNLAMPFSNSIQLSADGKATNLGTNKLVLTVQPATGLFTGTVTAPETTKSIPFKGAVHQKGNYGAGFFSGTDQTGQVGLNP